MGKNQTSFKPGIVTNPKGRPKEAWTMSGLIRESLEETNESGVSYKKVIARKLTALGARGDMTAIKEIANRTDGMPKQTTEITGDKEIPLVIKFVAEKPHQLDDGDDTGNSELPKTAGDI